MGQSAGQIWLKTEMIAVLKTASEISQIPSFFPNRQWAESDLCADGGLG